MSRSADISETTLDEEGVNTVEINEAPPEHDHDHDPAAVISDEDLDRLIATEGQAANPETNGHADPKQDHPGLRRPDPTGAPVVAVCGVSGGAGASTLTLLLGFAAAAQGRGGVLIADTGGSGASLAAIAKNRSQHSLTSAAHAHRLGILEPAAAFTTLGPDLRLIGREPELSGDELGDLDPELCDLLADAQEAHFAVFVDCGRLETAAQIEVARQATHIVWVTEGSATGARKARAVLDSTSITGSQADILFVRGRSEGLDLKAEREIRMAAEEADALLLFSPNAGDVVAQGIEATATRIVQPLRVALGRIL